MAEALQAVHAADLVHGDVKASNIMIESSGRLVLMDFGAGRAAESASLSASCYGTPRYMAPELFSGAGSSAASDIYAVGVVLFRMLSGTFPIDCDSLSEIIRDHENGSIERLPPRWRLQDRRLTSLVNACLAHNPNPQNSS